MNPVRFTLLVCLVTILGIILADLLAPRAAVNHRTDSQTNPPLGRQSKQPYTAGDSGPWESSEANPSISTP